MPVDHQLSEPLDFFGNQAAQARQDVLVQDQTSNEDSERIAQNTPGGVQHGGLCLADRQLIQQP